MSRLSPGLYAVNKTMSRMQIQLLCVRVLYSMGSRGLKQWVVTSISHMGEMRDSDWSRPNLLRSDWSGLIGAIITTLVLKSFLGIARQWSLEKFAIFTLKPRAIFGTAALGFLGTRWLIPLCSRQRKLETA